jgi:EAL domain-containing protein (putative c-di-GMP-specific phosphodiesterase class I)/serine/threonine protein kinase
VTDGSNLDAAPPLPAGFKLHWYEIYSVVGRGGFGVTYTGWDTNLNQAVAIKEYYPTTCAVRTGGSEVRQSSDDPDGNFVWGLRRFIDEARTLARLRHPNIVRVLSVFEANGSAYMVMELERGVDLEDALSLHQLDDDDALLAVLYPLVDGLTYVHRQGFIHRDIKTSNILLRDDGTPVLLDFGSARRATPRGARNLTTVVSRGFAPFEQYNHSGDDLKQGPWTDVYSLGATLYRIISGTLPVDSLTRGRAFLDGGGDPLAPPTPREGTSFSSALIDAAQSALALRPVDRPQSAATWADLLPALGTKRAAAGPAERVPIAHPIGKPQPASVTTVPTISPERIADLNVLVVDDERHALTMTCRVVESLGVGGVSVACDGEEALEFIEHSPSAAQVLVCDLDMPRMDGLELMRHLGSLDRPPSVILLGSGDERLLAAAQSLALSHDLSLLGSASKPVRPEFLLQMFSKFDSDKTAQPERHAATLSVEELNDGLANDALNVVYQPKVSVVDRKVVGVEALARWNHPSRGLLGPNTFIPVALEAGRMDVVTDQVFRAAMAQAGTWGALGYDLGVAVNFAVDDLRRLDLPEYIVACANDEGVDPGKVTLEVTESRVMTDFRVPLEILARLRLRRVGLSIDDFGKAYSSVERIRHIPFTEMKVDREFVYGASADLAARTILESSIALGRSLGLALVAEGVETNEDWDLVQRLGCDFVQGYFVARPMTGDEIPDWVTAWAAAS